MKTKIMYVKWVDAQAENGWSKTDEIEGIHECEAIGFLVKETKDYMALAATISKDQANAVISIPKAWIKNKRIIKL